jgi:hypothetical protein
VGITYANLDDQTRAHMLEEIAAGNHYLSPRLTPDGREAWPAMLAEAAQSYVDDWIAEQLLARRYLHHEEEFIRHNKTFQRRINQPHAAQMLAEGEFNRYYLRGLCVRAQVAGQAHLLIYRGKEVSQPRPESEAKIGTLIATELLLSMLRTNDFITIEQVIGVPGGPNSGLTCKLPD